MAKNILLSEKPTLAEIPAPGTRRGSSFLAMPTYRQKNRSPKWPARAPKNKQIKKLH